MVRKLVIFLTKNSKKTHIYCISIISHITFKLEDMNLHNIRYQYFNWLINRIICLIHKIMASTFLVIIQCL